MHQGQQTPGQGTGGSGQKRIARGHPGGHTAQGAHQHHAFHPEIEDAAALGDNFPQGGQQHGDGGFDRNLSDEGQVFDHDGVSSCVAGASLAAGRRTRR
jgi:hypothetical protein